MPKLITFAALLALSLMGVGAKPPTGDAIKASLKAKYDAINQLVMTKQGDALDRKYRSITTKDYRYTDEHGQTWELESFLKRIASVVRSKSKVASAKTQIDSISIKGARASVNATLRVSVVAYDTAGKKHIFYDTDLTQETWKEVSGEWKLASTRVLSSKVLRS
jgi:hypothetical protein